VTDPNRPLDSALDLLVFVPVGLAVTAAEELPKLAAKGRMRVEQQIAVARVVGQFAVTKGRVEIGRRFTGSAVRFPGGRARAGQPPAGQPPAGQPPAGQPPAGQPDGAFDEPDVADRLPDAEDAEGTVRVADAGLASATQQAPPAAPDAPRVETMEGGPQSQPDPASESSSLTGPEPPADSEPDSDIAPDTGSSSEAAPTSKPGTAAVAEPVPGPAAGDTSPVEAPSAENLAIPGYDSLSASQVVQRLGGLSEDELAAVGAYEAAHRARQTVLTRVSQLQVDRD
jgi:hypothetical protein